MRAAVIASRVLVWCALLAAVGVSAVPLAGAADPARGDSATAPGRAELAPAPASAAAGVVSAGGTGSIAPAAADVSDFVFDSMRAQYTLSVAEDGTASMRVVETFVAVFPQIDQNRGMQRAIPQRYQGLPTWPEATSVTDEDGNPRPMETDSDDGYLIVTSRADEYLRGRQTFVFTYDVHNVTRPFKDTGVDELYWDVNGTGWSQPFGRVDVQLVVPAELATEMTGDGACYWGDFGDTTTCELVTEPGAGTDTLVSASVPDLGPGQTVTIAVAFQAGTFATFDTSFLASVWGWLQVVAAALLAGLVGVVLWLRTRLLADEPGRGVVIAEYTPPEGVDALLASVLLGRSSKGIPAEILEQAVLGSIRVIQPERTGWSRPKPVVELVDPSEADANGRVLLRGLFRDLAPGSTYSFGRRDQRVSTAAQRILRAARKDIAARGWRRMVSPGIRIWPVALAFLLAITTAVLGAVAIINGTHALAPVLLLLAGIMSIFVVVALVSHKPLSASGAEVRDRLLGLRVFIEWAEADRIRMLQSPEGAERVPIDTNNPRQMLHLYESLLPYAVVFGQEKQWAQQLATMYGEGHTPNWYSGSGPFTATAFASGLSQLSTSSASSSSSSGGSSGSGSAGGGGGGGGGGGV